MKRNINSKDGFTIIEVLIVLAIAGLIMAVVLLAVPGLQRSQANTAAKTDASHIAAAVSSWSGNNNGVAPTTLQQMYSIYQNVGSLSKYTTAGAALSGNNGTAEAGSASGGAFNFTTTAGGGIYPGWYLSNGTNPITTTTALNATNAPMQWVVIIDPGANCTNGSEAGTTITLTTGNSTNIAILFTTETSGDGQWNCVQAQ